MKYLIVLILLSFSFSFSWGQHFYFPDLIKSGKKVKEFIPEGWDLIDSTSNDLNNDQLRDFVFVLEYSDSICTVKNENDLIDTLKYQPRILVILFTDPVSQQLQLVEQNNRFILVHDHPNMNDPFLSVKIENELLVIDFQLFYYSGISFITNTTYRFKYQNSRFELVSADNNFVQKATHDLEEYHFDFLNGKWCLTTENENTDDKKKKECDDLKNTALKTLSTLQEPYTWEVIPGVFL